jgi:hypothetical protein
VTRRRGDESRTDRPLRANQPQHRHEKQRRENPHPFVLTKLAEQRGADLRTQVERDRLARRAAGASDAVRRQPWTGLPAVVATAVALALLLAAGNAAGQEFSPPAQPALAQAVDDTDADALQKVREATP